MGSSYLEASISTRPTTSYLQNLSPYSHPSSHMRITGNMSKERGVPESAMEPTFVPSAPPSYDEAMQQAGASNPAVAMPGAKTVLPQAMPMPMHQTHPQSMPMTNYYPAQAASLPPSVVYSPPMQVPAPPTVIFTTLGRDRCFAMCPECNAQVMTETLEKHKCLAHFFCCCLMFSCPCCSCLPYCMDSCKIVKHSCPNCGSHLGTYRP